MQRITGIPASNGRVVGPLRRLRHAQCAVGRVVREPRHELALYQTAVRIAAQQLSELEGKAQESDQGIFMVQRMMLEDAGLREEICTYIEVGAGAAAAVERAAGIYAEQLRNIGDDYMSERACDVLDACQRIVDILDGSTREKVSLSEPSILAADEIYPTDIVSLDRNLVLGFVTARGSVNAHASIIARTMGIPAVVQTGAALLIDCDGKFAALDGASGEVYVMPDEATKARFMHALHMEQRHLQALNLLHTRPCQTKDGTRVQLFANCTSVQDVETAVEMGAEGVGLLLSEYFLLAGHMASEEQQYQFYKACLAAAGDRVLAVCTYDIGPDQGATGLVEQDAPNPALGLRGLRYCLAHPTFFHTQLAALLRASVHGHLRIIMSMVASENEFERALDAVYRTKVMLRQRGERFDEKIEVGSMIETPAAALEAEALAVRASFFNIGVKDLTQYTHAADRTSELVHDYFPDKVLSPAVKKLMKMTLEAANKADISVCISGETAANPMLAEQYVRMGVRCLSMPARSLPDVKEYLLDVTI